MGWCWLDHCAADPMIWVWDPMSQRSPALAGTYTLTHSFLSVPLSGASMGPDPGHNITRNSLAHISCPGGQDWPGTSASPCLASLRTHRHEHGHWPLQPYRCAERLGRAMTALHAQLRRGSQSDGIRAAGVLALKMKLELELDFLYLYLIGE